MPVEPMKCARCGSPMNKVSVAGGIEIDCCDEHGVWLDLGELDAIVKHYERSTPGVASGIGRKILDSAAHGAGFGAGSSLARGLIQRLLG